MCVAYWTNTGPIYKVGYIKMNHRIHIPCNLNFRRIIIIIIISVIAIGLYSRQATKKESHVFLTSLISDNINKLYLDNQENVKFVTCEDSYSD